MRGQAILAAIGAGILALGVVTSGQASPIIIGNGDAGFDTTGGFNPQAWDAGKAYEGNFMWVGPVATASAWCSWNVAGLAPGDYDVFVTWAADRPSWNYDNTAAAFSVIDGGTVTRGWPDWDINLAPGAVKLQDLTVDERQNPAGTSYGGLSWYQLGTYTITGSQLSVMLSNQSTSSGSIMADAVMVQAAVPEPASLGLAGMAGLMMLRRRV